MSELCYWCECDEIVQCKHCHRNFCKFCLKTDLCSDEEGFVCFVCGCLEWYETKTSSETVKDIGSSCLQDREMQDLFHRYEDLNSNKRVVDSIDDILINIDSLNSKNSSNILKTIKSNLSLMLKDIDKIESMIGHAKRGALREGEIDTVMIPLLKVVVKHHFFRKMLSLSIVNDFEKKIDKNDEKETNAFIDLTEEKMMLSKNVSVSDQYDEDDERVQRSPLSLSQEEKLTAIFEVNSEAKEDDNDIRSSSLVRNVISSETEMKRSPKVSEEFLSKMFQLSDESMQQKRKRTRRMNDVVEKKNVRLRSESNMSSPSEVSSCNQSNEDPSAINLHPDSVNRDSSKNITDSQIVRKPPKLSSPGSISSKEEMSFQSFLEHTSKSESNLNRFSRVISRNKNAHLVSPAPICYERPFVLTDVARKKSTPGPDVDDDLVRPPGANKIWSWERPPPLSLANNKFLIPIKTSPAGKTVVNGSDLSKIITNGSKPGSIIIQKSLSTAIIPLSSSSSINKLRLVTATTGSNTLPSSEKSIVSVPAPKRSLSPDQSSYSDEPKKKRGRPRKYFNHYVYNGDSETGMTEPTGDSLHLSTTSLN